MERRAASRLAVAVLVAVGVYVAVDVALVFLRPQFSVLHNAESDYGSRGPWDWVMDLNFVLRGLLSLALVAALARSVQRTPRLRAALWLLAVWAVCSALLALFPDDPAGTKLQSSGRVHLVLAAIAFLCVAVGTILGTLALRGDPRFGALTPALGVLSVGAAVVLLAMGHTHLHLHTLGALYEKIFLGLELAWLSLCAARVVRPPAPAAAALPAT